MTMYQRKKQATIEFAKRITEFGFKVYISKQETHGFVTDDEGGRVMSFQDIGSSFEALGGNYGPPSTESGTGWRMDAVPSDLDTAEKVKAALYEYPPSFCGSGWKYFTDLKKHLEVYESCCGYKLFENPEPPESPVKKFLKAVMDQP